MMWGREEEKKIKNPKLKTAQKKNIREPEATRIKQKYGWKVENLQHLRYISVRLW